MHPNRLAGKLYTLTGSLEPSGRATTADLTKARGPRDDAQPRSGPERNAGRDHGRAGSVERPPVRSARPCVSAAVRRGRSWLGAGISQQFARHHTVQSLLRLRGGARFGDDLKMLTDVLDSPVFAEPVPPPLSTEAVKRLGTIEYLPAGREPAKALTPGAVSGLLERRAFGPFIRCRNVIVAEWQTIGDVPDITFSVEQDTDGDGTDEVIYSESYFDVRWNAGYIAPVTLYASADAIVSHLCEGLSIPGVNTPSIGDRRAYAADRPLFSRGGTP